MQSADDLNYSVFAKKHPVLRNIMNFGFKQMVQFSTHMAGRLIDLVFHFSPNDNHQCVKVKQQSPYFTDHDMLFVVVVSSIKPLLFHSLILYFRILLTPTMSRLLL